MKLTPDLLMHAYSLGVFPMAESQDSDAIYWMDPPMRGVLPLDGFRISRSLRRRIAREEYRISLNEDFEGVIDACAEREETWINADIKRAYCALHTLGNAQSLEVWRDNKLIGGVYGVTLGAAFFGESMFSRETDASKIALAYLVTHLRKCGFRLFDTQYLTDHLASLGAIEIPRAVYHALLESTVDKSERFEDYLQPPSVSEVLQRNTQTSNR